MYAPTLIIVLAAVVPFTVQQQNPRNLPWEQWADQQAYLHVINLTEYLVRDVTYKLRHAEKIQEKHKHSITYELGTIAAGILDHFKNMLKLYRKYSEERSFIRRDYPVWHYMYAFHIIQGEYNEIRLEQNMFYDIVRDYEATLGATTKFTFPAEFTLPPRGARRFGAQFNTSFLGLEKQMQSSSTRSRIREIIPKFARKTKSKSLWKPSW